MIAVKAGDTLDAVCGWGNRNYGADTTALTVTVKSKSGKTWDAAKDFSIQQNPNGVWSYGMLTPADKPDSSTFKLFPTGVPPSGRSAASAIPARWSGRTS